MNETKDEVLAIVKGAAGEFTNFLSVDYEVDLFITDVERLESIIHSAITKATAALLQAIENANWLLSDRVDAGGGIKSLKEWTEAIDADRKATKPIFEDLWKRLDGDEKTKHSLNRKNIFDLMLDHLNSCSAALAKDKERLEKALTQIREKSWVMTSPNIIVSKDTLLTFAYYIHKICVGVQGSEDKEQAIRDRSSALMALKDVAELLDAIEANGWTVAYNRYAMQFTVQKFGQVAGNIGHGASLREALYMARGVQGSATP